MLREVGLDEPARASVSRAALRLLGLHCFYTAGPAEVRAWPIPLGATAQQAAARVHSAIGAGLVRARTYSLAELQAAGSVDRVAVRSEPRTYVVGPGDVFNFLFHDKH